MQQQTWITTRLANLWQHISRNPVFELHGSRKLRAEHQSIETALVDIEHQSTTHRLASILLKSFCPYFHLLCEIDTKTGLVERQEYQLLSPMIACRGDDLVQNG